MPVVFVQARAVCHNQLTDTEMASLKQDIRAAIDADYGVVDIPTGYQVVILPVSNEKPMVDELPKVGVWQWPLDWTAKLKDD